MLLVETSSYDICEFFGDRIPPYAILSHTWGEGEVSLQDMLHGRGEGKAGYEKIKKCCEQAQRDGFAYAWIDTCCIDKSSSAELSEAINSMYDWYQKSQICYVYLVDTKDSLFVSPDQCSRWFTRGWTLQELLAPTHVEFYDQDWKQIGTKFGMATQISSITGISPLALLGTNPRHFFVAERFSWAAGRKTARVEDRAYSLLGLFNIHMPLLYGEGTEAFQRLQKKILKYTDDRTVLAWIGSKLDDEDGGTFLSGLLAKSPDDFADSQGVFTDREPGITYQWPPKVTTQDVILTLPMVTMPHSDNASMIFVDLGCKRSQDTSVFLRLFANGRYRAGKLITMYDRVREEFTFVERTVAVARHSLIPPSRTPLAYRFSGVDVLDVTMGDTLQLELQYFGPSEVLTDETSQHHIQELLYSDSTTFNAANLSELPALRTFNICNGNEVVLQPHQDRDPDDWDEETPKNRIAYAICMAVLRAKNETLCRIAIGALHDPINRPWCIIERPEPGSADEEWFLQTIRTWDAGHNTPDQGTTVSTLPSGEQVKIAVTLKKAAYELKHGVKALPYNVLIFVTPVEDTDHLAPDETLTFRDYGFPCSTDPIEQEEIMQSMRGVSRGLTWVAP